MLPFDSDAVYFLKTAFKTGTKFMLQHFLTRGLARSPSAFPAMARVSDAGSRGGAIRAEMHATRMTGFQ
jgi:hypothetical protein